MLGSTIPVSIIGARFSMSVIPVWKPSQYGGYTTACPFSSHSFDTLTIASSHRWHAMWKYRLSYCHCRKLHLARASVSLLALRFGTCLTDPRLSLLFVSENKDRIETRLAFGATRFEACKPVAVEALRLALTPCINQMRYARSPYFCVRLALT